jgi:SAM-dependent methyltransferase
MDLRSAWQGRADAWVRWARSPELDNDFWLFHLRCFLDLRPAPGRLTVDVGCGEGRLTRALAGYQVVGADTACALVKAALTHPQSAPAIVADATRLPFPDGSADLRRSGHRVSIQRRRWRAVLCRMLGSRMVLVSSALPS